MKKSLVIVSVFLVIAIICSTFITIAVGAKTDEVVFTEDRLTGDISEISGITAVCHTTYDDLLFWDSSCTFEDEIKTETEFKAYQTKNWDTYHADPEGVHMDSNIYSDRFYDYIHTEDPDYELAGIGVAMMELYEECAPGEEVKKVIDLQDYCEYYPINFTIDMPNYIVGWNSDIIIDDWVLFNDNEAALIDNFMEYFRIPVPDECYLEISLSKNGGGYLASTGIGSTSVASENNLYEGGYYTSDSLPPKIDGDEYYLNSYSVLSDDGCYFTFSNQTSKGNLVDTSLIPGGYGIYYMPFFEEVDHSVTIDPDCLETVYPLPENTIVTNIEMTTDNSQLIVYSVNDFGTNITFIDVNTMEEINTVTLNFSVNGDEEERWKEYIYESNTDVFDDFIIVQTSRDDLFLLEKNDDGIFELKFRTSTKVTDDIYLYYDRYLNTAVWDGEKLYIMSSYQDFYGGNYIDCDFSITAIDESGVVYAANFISSLHTGMGMEYEYSCRKLNDHPYDLYLN